MLREVLLEWKERKLPENIIRRDIDVWFNNHILSLIGPRRAGKTYFMFQLINDLFQKGYSKNDVVYIDFTDTRAKRITISQFLKEVNFLFKGNPYLFLDEIQELDNWQSFLRVLHNKNYKIIISGSSSKLLSKEISTELRGRCIPKIIFPFSFKEFLDFKKFSLKEELSQSKIGELLRLLAEYLEYGGYPEIISSPENKRIEIAKTYFTTIFFKDVVERFKVRNIALMDYFVRRCIANTSSYMSLSKITSELKSMGYAVSKKTLSNYIKFLEEALFVFQVKRFSFKYRERAKHPSKTYLVDNVYFSMEPRFTKDLGKKMENLVAISLLRKKFDGKLDEVFYFKNGDFEVDFVLKDGLRIKQLIQASFASSRDEVAKREITALLKASSLLKCKDMLIITWDYEDEIKLGNKAIKYMPLWKWLIYFGEENQR